MGPIDEMWQMFGEASNAFETMRPDQLNNAKYIFFMASINTYNLMSTAYHSGDPQILSDVTKAMKHNFDMYCDSFQGLMEKPWTN